MRSMLLVLALSVVPAVASAASNDSGISLTSSSKRSQSLLGAHELAGDVRPSTSPVLRLTDAWRLGLTMPTAIDQGGGMGSDERQILALILGIIPGFGLGHLVAGDHHGFILFLIIDIALYILWGVVSEIVWTPFGYVGGLVWLVVHIIEGLDAYAAAGGERVVENLRGRAIEIAHASLPTRSDEPAIATRLFSFSF